MGRALLIGQVAARTGVSRKALRLYETAGILPRPARTPTGYRVYGEEALSIVGFVTQARRLGLSLREIREIIAIRLTGQAPCVHVRALARRKLDELDRRLAELAEVRDSLRQMLRRSGSSRGSTATVCRHIEQPRQDRRRNAR